VADGIIEAAKANGPSRLRLLQRKWPYPPFRKRSFHLPLGPPRESLETAATPGRSPVVSRFSEVDDPATDARERPGRRLRPVDVRFVLT
jgi:hypothetical protein